MWTFVLQQAEGPTNTNTWAKTNTECRGCINTNPKAVCWKENKIQIQTKPYSAKLRNCKMRHIPRRILFITKLKKLAKLKAKLVQNYDRPTQCLMWVKCSTSVAKNIQPIGGTSLYSWRHFVWADTRGTRNVYLCDVHRIAILSIV